MVTQRLKITSLFRGARTHRIITAVIFIAILVAGYFVYEAVAFRVNKHAIEQTRAAIDSVYSDIVVQVGQPDNYKQTNDCSRSYQEFTGYGDITCGIDTILNYGVNNEAEANNLVSRIQTIISRNGSFNLTAPKSASITDRFVVNTSYHAASDSYKANGLNCKVNYVFDTPQETFLKISDNNKKVFEVTIGCYGPARGLYYPLAQ